MRTIKSDYLLKHWKRLSKKEISALVKNVDWYYLSRKPLRFEFIDKFHDYIIWEFLSFEILEEKTIEKYYKSLNFNTVLSVNILKDSFIIKNIYNFKEYIDNILYHQKHLSKKTTDKLLMIKEMCK